MRNVINKLSACVGLTRLAFAKLPDDNRILFFRRDRETFGFLSNFHPCRVEIDARVWPHTEAYYQAQKSTNPDYVAKILENDSPGWSKRVGDSRIGKRRLAKQSWFRKHPEDLRPDWNEVKPGVMRVAVNAKFTQNDDLRRELLNTWPAELIEDSPYDSFWGWGADESGTNMLGVILMEVRETLRTNS